MDLTEMEGGEGVEGEGLAPRAQIIITACWLTMKEIALLLGSLAKCTPLPGEINMPVRSMHHSPCTVTLYAGMREICIFRVDRSVHT